MDKSNRVIKLLPRPDLLVLAGVLFFFGTALWAQAEAPSLAPTPLVNSPVTSVADAPVYEEIQEDPKNVLRILDGLPNKRRIRRDLTFVKDVKVDEELLIPAVPLSVKPTEQNLVEIVRIKNTDIFRITPKTIGSGIITLTNQKTGQIYSELHIDVRDSSVDKAIRELKALLIDIEGLEFKVVNGSIVIDGFVMLPQDLIRVSHVVTSYRQIGDPSAPRVAISSLVTLSPIARKRIIEYISREVNNPEVTITSIGDYVKLEGSVNSPEEKTRIQDLVSVYLPAFVKSKPTDLTNVEVAERKISGNADGFILNLITVRKAEDKEPEAPKMIQVVFHFVEFSERYLKSFSFDFSPTVSAANAQSLSAQQSSGERNSVESIANVINNLLPKMNWAKTHGFLRVLDTASILVQQGQPASINRGANSASAQATASPPKVSSAETNISVTPNITQPRAGLIEMKIDVSNKPSGGSISSNTKVNTTITVRDRQSAAFGGLISKASDNDYGSPANKQAFISFGAAKAYNKQSSNFVVFVTPIIKSSASAGVEQVKKKFRLKE